MTACFCSVAQVGVAIVLSLWTQSAPTYAVQQSLAWHQLLPAGELCNQLRNPPHGQLEPLAACDAGRFVRR
jgi:hypothetical protein